MNHVTILVKFFDTGYYLNNCFYTWTFFKNINIIMFENLQGIKPMGFSASLDDKKKYFINMKMLPILLIRNKKIKEYTQWAFVTLGATILLTTKKVSKHRQQKKMTFVDNIYITH